MDSGHLCISLPMMSPLYRKAKHILLLITTLSVGETLSSQTLFYREDFEQSFRNDVPAGKSTYMMESYSLRSKNEAVNLHSDNQDPAYSEFYSDNRCTGDSSAHGFYASIIIYDRPIPSFREMLVFQLDSILPKDETSTLTLDVLYHIFTEYRVDSLQGLLLENEKDIKAWLADRPFSGQYVCFSLGAANNRTWQRLNATFHTRRPFRYLLLGNLKNDEDCKVVKKNDCDCCAKPKNSFWKYSELLVDNITITTN
jgi:hypothetical protein